MSVSKIRFGIYAFCCCSFFSFPSLKTKKEKKILESALIISHCTEYSALSLMVSPAVVWGLLGFFVCFCSLPQFEMISKAPDLKKKKRGKKKKKKPCQKCLLLML